MVWSYGLVGVKITNGKDNLIYHTDSHESKNLIGHQKFVILPDVLISNKTTILRHNIISRSRLTVEEACFVPSCAAQILSPLSRRALTCGRGAKTFPMKIYYKIFTARSINDQ